MQIVVWLHVSAAVFLVGPQTVATAVAPRYIRAGAEGLPVLRFLQRTTRIYGLATVVVALLGAGAVVDEYDFGQFWVSSSLTLFVVAYALLLALVLPDLRRAVGRLEAGETAAVEAGRILGVGAAVAVIWLGILLLMVYKPGA